MRDVACAQPLRTDRALDRPRVLLAQDGIRPILGCLNGRRGPNIECHLICMGVNPEVRLRTTRGLVPDRNQAGVDTRGRAAAAFLQGRSPGGGFRCSRCREPTAGPDPETSSASPPEALRASCRTSLPLSHIEHPWCVRDPLARSGRRHASAPVRTCPPCRANSHSVQHGSCEGESCRSPSRRLFRAPHRQ